MTDFNKILQTSDITGEDYGEESIMEYDKICYHDSGFLCEHRREHIIELIDEHSQYFAEYCLSRLLEIQNGASIKLIYNQWISKNQ
jgi:hypothetical protein